ncbi:MAG: universal stress protein [bacterium]|nr:universal stress protein [bacterium]
MTSPTADRATNSFASQIPQRVLLYVSLGEDLLPAESAPELDRQLVARCLALCGADLQAIHILHVIDVDSDDPSLQLPNTEALLREESERARALIEADLRPLLPDGLRERCSISVSVGAPSEEILKTARAEGCELIVLGAADLRGLERLTERIWHRGTVGRLLRKSELPICILDPESFAKNEAFTGDESSRGETRPPRRILVPVDFSPVSKYLVARAEALHAQHGCELYLLHVLRLSLQEALRRFPDRSYEADQYEKDIIQNAETKARELLGDRYDQWTVLLYQDRLNRAVPAVVAEYEIDFLLLAGISRRRTGLAGTVLGTNAEKILGATHIPAWIIKPTEDSDDAADNEVSP